MTTSITVAFRYLPGEINRAINAVAWRKLRFAHVVAPLTLLLGALCEIYFGGPKYAWLGVASVVAGLALMARLVIGFIVWPRLAMSRYVPEEYHWTFCDDAILVRARSWETRFAWGHHTKAMILRRFYLLDRASGYWVIPRRAFASADDERSFQALLAAHLPLEDHAGAADLAGRNKKILFVVVVLALLAAAVYAGFLWVPSSLRR